MEQIELGGKTFCSNCGMTIGESPEPEKLNISISHISENDTYDSDSNNPVSNLPTTIAPTTNTPNETNPLIVMEHSDLNADERSPIVPLPASPAEGMTPKPSISTAVEVKDEDSQKVADINSAKTPTDDSDHVREELLKMMGQTLNNEGINVASTPEIDATDNTESKADISTEDRQQVAQETSAGGPLTSPSEGENAPIGTMEATGVTPASVSNSERESDQAQTPENQVPPKNFSIRPTSIEIEPVSSEKPITDDSFGDIKPDLMESIFYDQKGTESKTNDQRSTSAKGVPVPSPELQQAVGVEIPNLSTKSKDFDEQVKKIDALGATGVLLDILDDSAVEKTDEKKIEAYEAAEELIDKIPFKQPKELKMFEELDSKSNKKTRTNTKKFDKDAKKDKKTSDSKEKGSKDKVEDNNGFNKETSKETLTVVSKLSERPITKSTKEDQALKIEEAPQKIENVSEKPAKGSVKILTPEEIMASFEVRGSETKKIGKPDKWNRSSKNQDKIEPADVAGALSKTPKKEDVTGEILYTQQSNDIESVTNPEHIEEKKDTQKKESYNKKEVDLSQFKTPNPHHSALLDYFANIFSNK
jgi:hypothetical protein